MGTAQYWPTVSALYEKRHAHFVSLAMRHLFNRDYAFDAVNDAFAETVKYFNKPQHKEKKVREHIVVFQVLKACKRINKRFSLELPSGLMNTDKETD